ncbi:MAG: pantoate--beta-alanine ligase [Planctomycetota bacterium]
MVPTVITTAEELAPYHESSFVPTMGALHAGHFALIEAAVATELPVIVSIFVNPTQFGPDEDLDRYPRTLEQDVMSAGRYGADVIFAPDVESVYPTDDAIDVPSLPDVATQPRLEEKVRPGHFEGVLQVVARLFDLVRPRYAIFGEKDYQQLLSIAAMVDEAYESGRWGELDILGHPTERDLDGLALSSRNQYLNAHQRARALGLNRALKAAINTTSPDEGESQMKKILRAHDVRPDYAVIRHAETLMPIDSLDEPARALIAARVDDVRLIDNGPVRE